MTCCAKIRSGQFPLVESHFRARKHSSPLWMCAAHCGVRASATFENRNVMNGGNISVWKWASAQLECMRMRLSARCIRGLLKILYFKFAVNHVRGLRNARWTLCKNRTRKLFRNVLFATIDIRRCWIANIFHREYYVLQWYRKKSIFFRCGFHDTIVLCIFHE